MFQDIPLYSLSPVGSDPQQDPRAGCLGSAIGMILAIILCALLSLLASSCRTKTIVVETRDSTSTHVHTNTVFVTDTQYVTLPPQKEYIVTPDSTSTLENDYAVSTASILGGFLHHSLQTKPTPVPVPVQHKETTRDSIVYREREVPVPVPVIQEVEKQLTRWQQARLHLANIMLNALALAAVAWLIRKRAWWLSLIRKFH